MTLPPFVISSMYYSLELSMAKRTPRATSEKRFVAVFNVALEQSSDVNVKACELPGWSLADYTRTGKLGLMSISRLLEVSRLFNSDLYAGGSISFAVVAAQKTKLERALYGLSGISCPMIYTRKIGYIGNTSFSYIMQLCHKDTGALMAKQEGQLVMLDSNTRKPSAVPHYLSAIRDKHPHTGFKVDIPHAPRNPSGTHTSHVKIMASDMDQIYHTNQSSYYRFAMDAAYEAAADGFLRNFRSDICEYEVQEFQGRNASETVAGDEISICVWEDRDDQLTLHFEMKNTKNNSPVAYITIKFYPLINSPL